MRIFLILFTLLSSIGYAQETKMTQFQKLFVNHIAYRDYQKAIDEMYKKEYKKAYSYAMHAKSIYPQNKRSLIALAYMPSYLRESAYEPKKIYYKIVIYKQYELDRLVTKIKLLSPPIPSVIVKRTSTYMDIIIRNYGDLPLDEFALVIDGKKVITYNKILPNEEKVYRYESAPIMHEIGFNERYGFAPKSIVINEEY
ncbi:hypothetical protein MNB_SM-3-7 [hydrothermal vent metagenome]|uniref:Uncharacterized protein n=1 Tax=hydrothermal vent metagenome TaxID=652676 RepID=A0A1W1D3T5_9ZZZZ